MTWIKLILFTASSCAAQAVAELKGTVTDFMNDFKGNFKRFIKHRRQYKTQRTAFKEKKFTLEEGEVVCVMDFQERLQVQEQDEVQSQHWDRDATTIFPCLIFFKLNGIVWAYCFQILSDDMAQDKAWVQYVMTKLLNEDIPALLRKVGAKPMTRTTIWTDNSAKQVPVLFWLGRRRHDHGAGRKRKSYRDPCARRTSLLRVLSREELVGCGGRHDQGVRSTDGPKLHVGGGILGRSLQQACEGVGFHSSLGQQ